VDDLSPLTPDDKPSVAALVLAALVHLLLVGALFFGVQWKSQSPSSIAVEVWRGAPAPVAVAKPEPAPEPPPPPPEPKPEPKPVPKVEPTPPVKPEITVKDDKKKKEDIKKPEPKPEPKKAQPVPERPDFTKQLEQELKDTQRQKASAKAAQEQRARADAELRQFEQARADQAALAREQSALARDRGRADYVAKIRGKIKGNIVLPRAIQGNPEAVFKVTQLPSGEIIDVKLNKSSGNRLLDEAIERAIKKSDPLPLPDQPGLFERVLELKYNPFDE
jgi:colicin import membrane protein